MFKWLAVVFSIPLLLVAQCHKEQKSSSISVILQDHFTTSDGRYVDVSLIEFNEKFFYVFNSEDAIGYVIEVDQ